jgi:hypothetical protein
MPHYQHGHDDRLAAPSRHLESHAIEGGISLSIHPVELILGPWVSLRSHFSDVDRRF